ncbi:hypothetical protein VB779_05565 [Haloarculaceae archaeon H-GB11]|nr:hypothetical protein [Haloarculaceae archaeon H-GB11]
MKQEEEPVDSAARDGESESVVQVTDDVSLTVPDDASDAEAAAIVAAVGAHLTDRQRAVAAAQSSSEPPAADRWKLKGRLRSTGKRRLPGRSSAARSGRPRPVRSTDAHCGFDRRVRRPLYSVMMAASSSRSNSSPEYVSGK